MWNKIYGIALAVGVLTMVALTYLSYGWLKSVTRPADVVANFESYSSLYWTVLCVSSLVLLVLANVVLWLTRRSWSLWATLAFFAFFVLLQTWWLNNAFLNYQKANNLTESTFSFMGLGGTLLAAAVAVGVFFDQFLVLRMRDRIPGAEQPVIEDVPSPQPSQPENLPATGQEEPGDEEIVDQETADEVMIESPPPPPPPARDEKI